MDKNIKYKIKNKEYLFFEDDLEIIKMPNDVENINEVIEEMTKEKFLLSTENYYKLDKNKIGTDKNKVISINLTNGCNLKCSYCFIEAFNNKMQLLTEKELIQKLEFNNNNINKNDRIALYFSGSGEPLINFKLLKKIPAICKKMNIKPSYYEINTNGTLITDEIAIFFKENNFVVNVSIDAIEKQHNATRKYVNGKDSYNDVYKGLNILLKHKINVACKTVIVPESNTTFETFKTYEIKKLPYVFDIATPSVEGDYVPQVKDLDVFNVEFKKTIDYLINKSKKGEKIYSLKIMNDLGKIHNRKIKQIGCNACLGSFYINKDNILYPCLYLSDSKEASVGSVEKGIDKDKIISNNLYAKHVNDYNNCKTCHIKYLCGGGCFAIKYIENGNTDTVSDYLCKYYKIYWDNLIRMYIEIYPFITDINNLNHIEYEQNNTISCN